MASESDRSFLDTSRSMNAVSAESAGALPFRRIDVVDRELRVILTGPTPDSLVPATESFEPILKLEVAAMIGDLRLCATSFGLGLIGVDHAVRVIEQPHLSADHFLVSTERVALRGALDRITRDVTLHADDRELLRLLVGGYEDRSMARRLGRTPANVVHRTQILLQKLGIADRRTLVALTYRHARHGIERRSQPRPGGVERRAPAPPHTSISGTA
ncbi:MAG: hypothetical protein NVS4B5_03680 [Vulcanimicrobiaceae bacterium]